MSLPNFDTTGLLAPQIPHAIELCEAMLRDKFGWDASGTGTGKTYVGAAIVRYLKQFHNRKFVVICPKLNIPKWAAVLAQFGVKAEFILNYETVGRGNLTKIYRYKKKGMKDIPYFLRGEFRFPIDWVVLLDESHRTKGIDTLNAGLLFALTMQGYTTLCMSATQAMTPLDMRAFGFASGLHKGMHHTGGRGQNYGMNIFKTFCQDAGAQFVGKWGAMYFDSEDPESKAKLQKIRDILFNEKKVASRMNREDFGNIFPHNQVESTSYDMGENGRRIRHVYNDMQTELAKLQDRVANYKNHVLAIITAARRKVELLKVPTFCEMAEDLMDEGKSVLIFVNYTDTIDALYARLAKKYGPDIIGKIHGEQTFKQRWDDIASFQADKKRILLINIAAGAEAIDLQDLTGKHPRAALINPSYRAIAVIQSIGRADRAYAKSDIWTNLVLAGGTIEDSVGAKFNHKKGHLDILNDGDLVPDGITFDVSRMVAGLNL